MFARENEPTSSDSRRRAGPDVMLIPIIFKEEI
jgi:hypothetical protein